MWAKVFLFLIKVTKVPMSNDSGGGWKKVEGGLYTGTPTREDFLSTLSNIDAFLVRASLYQQPQEMSIR